MKVSLPNFTKNDLKKIQKNVNETKKVIFNKAEVTPDHYLTIKDIELILNTISELYKGKL